MTKEQIDCLPSTELAALVFSTVVRTDETQHIVDEARFELRRRAENLNMYYGDYVRFYRTLNAIHA